jgi:DNA-binding CsgD family transcriptional regulator
MAAARTRIASPGTWITDMRSALCAARLSDAARLYDEHRPSAVPQATLMRARVYLKQRDYAAAGELLINARFSHATSEEQAERELLQGVAQTRARSFEAADECFERAASYGNTVAKSGELAYWQGRRYLEEFRPRDARRQLRALQAIGSADAHLWGGSLESAILSQEERYEDAAVALMHLMEYLDENAPAQIETAIWTLHTLSVLARELDVPQIRRYVEQRVNRQSWPADFRVNQFQTLKAAAWCHALEGDYFNALRRLKSARAIAPSPAWSAMISLDRAYLARCVGERRFSRDELAEAEDVLDTEQWRASDDEERVALILAAELLAPLDKGKASSYLAKFNELRDAISPQLHMRYDRRLAAQADYAAGIVQSALGNRQAALTAYRRSWSVYHTIGYAWRAGRCALRLFEMTNDAQWRTNAEEELRRYAGSWLYDELRSLRTPGDLPKLTRAQKHVFDLIIEGKSNEDISQITGRSTYTIQNHVNAVLRAFDVPNRSILISEAIKRGLVPR